MSSFFHTILNGIASFFVAVAITVGIVPAPAESPAVATSTTEVAQQQSSEIEKATAELEAKKKKSQQLEQNLQMERARQAAIEDLKKQQELESARQAQLQKQTQNDAALNEVEATLSRISAQMATDTTLMKEYQQKVLAETNKFNDECGSYTAACYQSYMEVVKYYGDGYQALKSELSQLNYDYKQYDLLRLQILAQQ